MSNELVNREAIHQLAFELGGTEGGEYWLDANDLDKLIAAALDEVARLNQPASAQQSEGWQFFQDGEWHMGFKHPANHRANTEAAGYPVRDLYAGPVVQPASAGDERAAGTKVSDASINCWSCKLSVSLDERADADGNCPHCRVELDLEEYLRAALSANHSEQVRDD